MPEGVGKPSGISSQGKSTWTAALVGESCSSALAGDINTLMPPPQMGIRPDPNPAAYTQAPGCPHKKYGLSLCLLWGGCHDWGASLAKDRAQLTLLPCQVTAGLASLLKLLVQFGRSSSLLRSRGTQSQLWFWRREGKPEYEFLKVEDWQTFIKAV